MYTKAYLGDIEGVRQEIDNDPLLVSSELPQHDSNVKVTVLHYAVAARQQRIVDLLLGRGAVVTPYSDWLVRFAIWRDDPQILQALIDAGADVMRSDPPRSGVSNPQIRAILCEAGVEENPDYSEGGWPPIVFLSRGDRGGNIQRIQDLIDRGANVNNVNYKGQTALHCASKAGFIEIVRLLMQHGATVNAVDKNGETPLIAALTSTIKDHARLSEVIRLLVDNGADLKHADRRGRTAVSIASRKKGRNVDRSSPSLA